MEAKPIEVIMRIDFSASNGTEILAHAEKVSELVRCKDCRYNDDGNCDVICETLAGDLIGVTLRCSDDFYCAYGRRRYDAEIH